MTVKDWGLYVYLNVIQKTANYWGNFFYTENAPNLSFKLTREVDIQDWNMGLKKLRACWADILIAYPLVWYSIELPNVALALWMLTYLFELYGYFNDKESKLGIKIIFQTYGLFFLKRSLCWVVVVVL